MELGKCSRMGKELGERFQACAPRLGAQACAPQLVGSSDPLGNASPRT